MHTRTLAIERMLESADHHIAQHQEDSAMRDPAVRMPQLPEGWIFYSAERAFGGSKKGWSVEIMDTTKPFHQGSIVKAWHRESLDKALLEAAHKIPRSTQDTAFKASGEVLSR